MGYKELFKRLIFEDLKCKQLGRWYLKSNIGHNKYVWKQKKGYIILIDCYPKNNQYCIAEFK